MNLTKFRQFPNMARKDPSKTLLDGVVKTPIYFYFKETLPFNRDIEAKSWNY